jgi:SAM-dependent methyltransferase
MPQDPSSTPAHEHNRRAWDQMVRKKQRFTQPAADDSFAEPLKSVDGLGWLGESIRGKKLLCLGAGGGKHAALYAAAGAEVTVVDISPAQLELDREVAAARELSLQTVEASMDHMPMFADGIFDVVIHPVSTCYVPNIEPVYCEVARITRSGGLYISQHKTPTSLQAETQVTTHGYELNEPYYRSGPLPPVIGSRHREEGTLEFLHRWEELIGLMCRSGFVIEDLVEPLHAKMDAAASSFGHRSQFVAPYVRIKARRVGGQHQAATQPTILMP